MRERAFHQPGPPHECGEEMTRQTNEYHPSWYWCCPVHGECHRDEIITVGIKGKEQAMPPGHDDPSWSEIAIWILITILCFFVILKSVPQR